MEQKDAPNTTPKRKRYTTQNSKIWTINFSGLRFVNKAKIVIPALKQRVDLSSIGLTILMAVEYCLREEIIQDFSAFVNTKRRGLIGKG